MIIDLYVDTSRKGISMAVATDGQSDSARYEEIVNPDARGEILGASVDELLKRLGATLDDVKRVMVTLGPGSFSGLRTGVAFCQGLCFSGKRELYGVTTLQALQCFAGAESTANEAAVVIRARNGYWYLRYDGKESFIETAAVADALRAGKPKAVVADAPAQEDETLKAVFAEITATVTGDTGKPLSMWAQLFNTVKPSLIQEANYIQPSYFEKLKA